MRSQEFAEYLSGLLGRSVGSDAVVTLTSGQQARAAAWLAERGFAPVDLRRRLGVPFAADSLLTVDGLAPTAAAARATSRRAEGTSVGIDIQRIDELIAPELCADPKSSPELTGIFTLREISYAQTRPELSATLAGVFAAKEALRKCDPALLARELIEVEVLPDGAGRPEFPGFSLSISHSGGFAIAVAVRTAPAPSPVLPELPPVEPRPPAFVQPSATAVGVGVAFKLIVLLGSLTAFALAFERLVR